MVSTVMTDHTRSYMSTRGLEGISSERGAMTDASLYMIGWGAGSQCMIGWGAGFQCMIGWGAGPCYVILQEEGFLPISELSRLLLLKFQMNTHTAEIQRERESLFMTTLIGLDGAQEV